MAKLYWDVDHAEITAKEGATAEGFDAHGIHSSCLEFGTGNHRHAPVASLGLGAPTRAILRTELGVDLSVTYSSALPTTHSEARTIVGILSNHFFDLAMEPV